MEATGQDEAARIEEAMAALEAQRLLLGDEVVETALVPLQRKLAALRARGEGERKQLTVLFARVTGLGPLEDEVAVEEASQLFRRLWPRLDAIVKANGGIVDKHVGDAPDGPLRHAGRHEDDRPPGACGRRCRCGAWSPSST
jgi:class 3 adenylate cyclase